MHVTPTFVRVAALLACAATFSSVPVSAQRLTVDPPDPLGQQTPPQTPPQARTQVRPLAVTHSDFYYTRLKVHRIGSYVMFPMFAGEYYLGNRLIKEFDPPNWVRSGHGVVAGGLGVLFGLNTATGLWNLWDSRHEGGALKYVHTALLIAADAGFVWSGATAENAREGDGANHHRNIAIGSMGVAAIGTAMMWVLH